MSLLALDQTFAGRRVPLWLRRFEAEPGEALRDLLLGGADLGHLNPADPERVLLDWIESLGVGSGLLAEVDRALASWIDRSWGDPDPSGLGAAVAAVAWCRAADLISGCPGEEGLSRAAKALRERFLEEPSFLRSIAEGRARDPEARAWLALAEHQSDRSLLPRWWLLCTLPPDVPWYHGDLGIYGLRGLPPETPSQAGGFPKEVPEGLARLADALARRVEDGWLESETARKEFTATARLTMAAYPFPQEKWLPYWRHVLQDRRLREPLAESWVRDLSPKLDQVPEKGPGARLRWIQPDPGEARRAQEIAARLGQGDPKAIELAQGLLEEQRLYAQATGDSQFVVRSACNFAGKLRKTNPRKALEWVRLALDFDPWNAFAWTTTATVNLTLGNISEAAKAAQEAVRRFPNDAVAHNGLAEVLRAQGRLDDAEQVYRLATRKFDNDPVAHNGLAEVLRAQGRLDDAEQVYRLATRKFDNDPFAHTGLAEVLRAQGRLDDAEQVYRLATRKFDNDPVAHNGLAEVLRAQGRLDDAEQVYRLATRKFDNDPFAHTGLAEVLRAQGRLDDAEQVYRLATRKFDNDPVAHNGLAEVLKDQGKLTEAEATYRHVLERFRSQPVALTGLAGLLRRRGELEEAERLFAEALQREPRNEATRTAFESLRAQRQGAASLSEVNELPAKPLSEGAEESAAGTAPTGSPEPVRPGPASSLPVRDRTDVTVSVPDTKTPPPRPAKVERLHVDDLNVLLADTLLLRRWARSLGGQDSGVRAGEVRTKAHAALEKLLHLEDRSSLAAGEAGLLTLTEGDLEEGLKLLREATRRFPGSARVRYALARAERLAVSARALDLRDLEAPVRPWRRLARLEAQLSAVALLGEARTWLGQTDGAVRESGARRSLGRLAFWIDEQLSREPGHHRKGATEINTWWAREARRLAFGDRKDRQEEDLTHLQFYLEMVQAHATELDFHEEDAVNRVAAA